MLKIRWIEKIEWCVIFNPAAKYESQRQPVKITIQISKTDRIYNT